MKPQNPIAWLAASLAIAGMPYIQAGEPATVAPAKPSPAKTTPPKTDVEPIVQLSPFEVNAENKGYYAANTMAGTRIGSKLEDLGASITVVTKEQMTDFAMLDINDIFNYEASTEGTGNYTAFSFNRNGQPTSDAQLNPQSANRIRGLSSANVTLGNFATAGWTPNDPLNIDAVEISRGPNASIFGIGNVGGTVNTIPAAANVTRNKSQVTTRADSNDGYRATLDLNRVLLPGMLAVRGSAAYQHDGFHLKPSGTYTTRYNGMIKYRPFKQTMLTASHSAYQMHGNRPNVTPPRDGVTDWVNRGSPSWDPTTLTAKVNGEVVSTGLPAYFAYEQIEYSNIYIDRAGIGYWQTGRSTLSDQPNTAAPDIRRLVNIVGAPQFSNQALFANSIGLKNKALYDWSSINLASMNYVRDQSAISSVLLDQTLIDTPRQLLALQLGYFREAGNRRARNIVGGASGVASVSIFQIDVNEKNIDGSPNAFFGRPFLGEIAPTLSSSEIENDTYRAQVVYKLDLRDQRNGLRWLGMHQVTGYTEYKHYVFHGLSKREVIVDNHTWLGPNVTRGGIGSAAGGLATGPRVAGGYFRYYVGDQNGRNVDYAPGDLSYGNYTMNYGNASTGFVRESVALGLADLGSGANGSLTILKSQGAILQSHVLKDRVVTTLGVRSDQRYSRLGTPTRLLPDGVTTDPSSYTQWRSGDWGVGKGPTRTAGIVVKPLRWISVYANKSDSFQPASVAQDLYLKTLPDPTGRGEDFGVALNLFEGKLNVRFNKYKTSELQRRNGESGTLAQRIQRIDFTYNSQGANDTFLLQRRATDWVTEAAAARGTTLTPGQIETEVAAIMKLPVQYLRPLDSGVTATDDNIGKGTEVEVNYNPTKFWTMKVNVAEQMSIGASIAPDLTTWIQERTAVWQTIIDPTLVNPDGSLGRPWYVERYNNGNSAKQFVDGLVVAPLRLYQAYEGKSKPQIRKYRVNYSTNFRLDGITDQPILKRFNVGGAVRWEDKGAIGFRGVQELPAIVTALDGSRPIYDKSHYYLDAFAGYRTRLFSSKVMATFQLNVRNANEKGRLQALSANPDGTPTAFRIVEPRQFILSATFDL